MLPFFRWRFRDNNARVAGSGFYLPEGVEPPAAVARINALTAAIRPLTSAVIPSATLVYRFDFPDSPPAAPEANLYSRLVLIFNDNTDYGVLSIPSPNPLSLDVDGAYRGIRASRTRLDMLGVLAELETALSGGYLAGGTIFPSTYLVGGITELS